MPTRSAAFYGVIAVAIAGLVGADFASPDAAKATSVAPLATFHRFNIQLKNDSAYLASFAFKSSEDLARGGVKVAPENGATVPPGSRAQLTPGALSPGYGVRLYWGAWLRC